MKLNSMTRAKLTEAINKKKAQLKRNLFMVTAFRATKEGSLMVEVCQNRALGGGKLTALQLFNRSNEKFKSETTLVFDWVTLTPEDYLAAVGNQTDATLEGLQQIAKTWSPDAPTGKDAVVYPQLDVVAKFFDPVNEIELTPVISVTEKTKSELATFFRGDNASDKIADVIDRDNRAMKTGSDADAEYLVCSETGEKIYRFTRFEFKEHGAEDRIIQGKITQSEYKKRFANQESPLATANIGGESNPLRNNILDEDSTI